MTTSELLPDGGYMISWTPDDEIGRQGDRTVGVQVGPWPDTTGWSDAYELTVHAEFVGTDREAAHLRDLALQLVLDGCPPADVLGEFSRILVWRQLRVATGAWAFVPDRWSEWNPHFSADTDDYWGTPLWGT